MVFLFPKQPDILRFAPWALGPRAPSTFHEGHGTSLTPIADVHELRKALALAARERIPPYLGQQRHALEDWFALPQL